MSNHFIPVKITKKHYADKLVQGEVFMRALHEFGSWGDISEKGSTLLALRKISVTIPDGAS